MLRYEKTLSNMQEVKAREGIVIAVACEGDDEVAKIARSRDVGAARRMNCCCRFWKLLPLQLLAYHIAVRRGCDVDQPRNLAKSVTVE